MIVNTLAPPTPSPSKPTQVNPITIPNPNHLSAEQSQLMRVGVASYGSNDQEADGVISLLKIEDVKILIEYMLDDY